MLPPASGIPILDSFLDGAGREQAPTEVHAEFVRLRRWFPKHTQGIVLTAPKEPRGETYPPY